MTSRIYSPLQSATPKGTPLFAYCGESRPSVMQATWRALLAEAVERELFSQADTPGWAVSCLAREPAQKNHQRFILHIGLHNAPLRTWDSNSLLAARSSSRSISNTHRGRWIPPCSAGAYRLGTSTKTARQRHDLGDHQYHHCTR